MKASRLRIGTSGWHYGHWRENFYPHGVGPLKYLAYYITQFNTVEINGSYYRLPSPETIREWYHQAPKAFLFAFKASRFLTHNKKLKDARDPLRRVLRAADGLKEKLGPILFQLPPFWRVNIERLREFLKILPKGYEWVFEFRNPTWYTPEVYETLASRQASLCFYDMKGEQSPRAFPAKWVYLRFHGAEGKYNGNYPHERLARWAKDMSVWVKQGRQVFAYFNNDPDGHAPKNAKELKDLLKGAL